MYSHSTATDYADLLNKVHAFLTGTGSAFDMTYAGTGDGTIGSYSGGTASVAETFTLTATGATTFTVTGSATGSLSDATVGSAYTSNYINFTISAGSTPFGAGDEFTLNTAPAWTAVRSVTGSEYVWTAPGNDGDSEIYVGALAFSNLTGDYYNWRLGGFTGYSAGTAFASLPGACTGPCLPLWNAAIEYWAVANGRRLILVAKVGTSYETAYLGLIQPYAEPTQFPYPLAVGGSMAWATEPAASSTNWRYSYTGDEHRSFAQPHPGASSVYERFAQLRLRLPSGTWRGVARTRPPNVTSWNAQVWPGSSTFSDLRPCLDGSYPLFNDVIHGADTDGSTNFFGVLDGIAVTTGYGNAAENTISVNGISWLVVPNVYRTGRADFFCVRLD